MSSARGFHIDMEGGVAMPHPITVGTLTESGQKHQEFLLHKMNPPEVCKGSAVKELTSTVGLPNFTLLKDWLCFITPDISLHLAKNSEVKKPTYKVRYVIY